MMSLYSIETSTADIYTLSLHDALPISDRRAAPACDGRPSRCRSRCSLPVRRRRASIHRSSSRSEEHTSELQSPDHIVCRLLLEKIKHLGHSVTMHEIRNFVRSLLLQTT